MKKTHQLKIGDGTSDWNSLSYLTGTGGGGSITTEEVQDIIGSTITGSGGIDVTYNDAGNTMSITMNEEFTSADRAKIDSIETSATADQTGSEIVNLIDTELASTTWKAPLSTEEVQDLVGAMIDGGSQTNITAVYDDVSGVIDFTVSGGGGGLDQEQTEDIVENLLQMGTGLQKVYDDGAGTLTLSLTDEIFTSSEKTKLAGVETGATADQTGAEIKALYEGEADTNAFTDADESKLDGIAAGATVNDTDANLLNRANHTGTQLASTISDFDTAVSTNTAVAANTLKNSYPAIDASKLAAIEDGATEDQTGAEIEGLLDTELGNTRWSTVEVPSGGAANAVLYKSSGNDYGYTWTLLTESDISDLQTYALDADVVKLNTDNISNGADYSVAGIGAALEVNTVGGNFRIRGGSSGADMGIVVSGANILFQATGLTQYSMDNGGVISLGTDVINKTYGDANYLQNDEDVPAAASATNYTPSAATVEGHLSGIDAALGAGISTDNQNRILNENKTIEVLLTANRAITTEDIEISSGADIGKKPFLTGDTAGSTIELTLNDIGDDGDLINFSGNVLKTTAVLQVNEGTALISNLTGNNNAFSVSSNELAVLRKIGTNVYRIDGTYTEIERDIAAPTVQSATVENSDTDALIVVFNEAVNITNVTGLSLDGDWTGTTITGINSGSGTNTISLALDTPVANGESGSFVYSGSNTISDLSSNALASGSTSVTNNVAGGSNLYVENDAAQPGAGETNTVGSGWTDQFFAVVSSGTSNVTDGSYSINMAHTASGGFGFQRVDYDNSTEAAGTYTFTCDYTHVSGLTPRIEIREASFGSTLETVNLTQGGSGSVNQSFTTTGTGFTIAFYASYNDDTTNGDLDVDNITITA